MAAKWLLDYFVHHLLERSAADQQIMQAMLLMLIGMFMMINRIQDPDGTEL